MSPAPAPAFHLLDLPAELLERIVAAAAGGRRRGHVPFAAWAALGPVCRAFRAALHAAVRRVVLADCYALPRAYPSHAAFVDAPRRVLRGPLLRCRALADLDVAACDALADDDIAWFAAKARATLRAFAITVCHTQTDAAMIAVARAAARALRTVDISGCDRHRHGAVSPSVDRAARHVPCDALSNTSVVALSTFCAELRQVSISNSANITDTALAALATIPALSDVLLRRLPAVTDLGIRSLANGKGRLTSLSLHSNTALGDESLHAIVAGPATRHSLLFFGLTFNYGVTDDGLGALVEGVPTLDELQVDHCAQVSDDWTVKVKAGGGLSRVSMRAVGLALTAGGLELLACGDTRSVTKLRALNLGFVSSVNASTLTVLLNAAPQLVVLVLDACSNVDDEAAEVLGRFPELTTLDLSWCAKLTAQGVIALCNAVAGPRLQRLSVGPIAHAAPDSADDADEAAAEGEDAAEQGNGMLLGADAQPVAEMPVVDVHNSAPGSYTAPFASGAAVNAADVEGDDSALAEMMLLGGTHSAVVPSSAGQEERAEGAYDGVATGELKGSTRDAALFEIGEKCVALRELILCGGVQPSTVEWLRRHTRARIEYMEAGICSSVYQPDDEFVE